VNEQGGHVMDDGGGPAAEPAPVELTGHESVDAVLRSLDGLSGRPVGEHVAVFEAAHESLRAALSDAATRPGAPYAG
jgi:hypothetical protein